MMRKRPAPMASRMAISFCLAAARDQQARDIGARDQQHAAGQGHQHPQRRRQHFPDARLALRARQGLDHVPQELRPHFGGRIVEGRFLHLRLQHAVEIRLQRRLRLPARYAGFQTSEYVHPASAAVVEVERLVEQRHELRPHHQRNEDLAGGAQIDSLEALLRHADDCEVMPIHSQRLPDNRGVAGEARLPVAVAQHRHRMAAGNAIVVRGKRAPQRRTHPQHREIRSRDQLAAGQFGRSVEPQAELVWEPAEHAGEHRVIRFEIPIHRVRERVWAPVAAVVHALHVEQHQLLRILDRHQPQQHLIQQREDGGVRANPQRQG